MNENTNESSFPKRKFIAGQFEGPLDLLWSLIRENRINIYDIPIAEITEQFLNYLDYVSETNLQDLSEFYSWAAKLVHIKSRMLLPVEITYNDDESMEDPRAELVEQLIEYQRFKKLSLLMEEQEEQNEWNLERRKVNRFIPFEKKGDEWEKVDADSLLLDMKQIYMNLTSSNTEILGSISDDITPNEKITLMNEFLERKGECMFSELITQRGNPLDLVCAFIAILEAAKFDMAEIYQNKIYGDIKICRKNLAAKKK